MKLKMGNATESQLCPCEYRGDVWLRPHRLTMTKVLKHSVAKSKTIIYLKLIHLIAEFVLPNIHICCGLESLLFFVPHDYINIVLLHFL